MPDSNSPTRQLLGGLSLGSTYRAIQHAHAISPGGLRPDLVIRRYGDRPESWLLIEVKGGERTVEHSARAATFDLLAYRTAFAPILDRQQAPFGLGIAYGADLHASPTADVMLCTPDTLAALLERFQPKPPHQQHAMPAGGVGPASFRFVWCARNG